MEINSAWETIREKDSLGYYELRKHKPWFDEGCSELSDLGKQAKLQWLQDPREINENNLNNVRHEANSYFRNKKREYLGIKYICTVFIYLFIYYWPEMPNGGAIPTKSEKIKPQKQGQKKKLLQETHARCGWKQKPDRELIHALQWFALNRVLKSNVTDLC
jgi:hypothetical protein